MLHKRCKCPARPNCLHPYWYTFEIGGRRYSKSTRTANKQTAGRIEQKRRDRILDPYVKDDDGEKKITLKKHIADYTAHTAKKNATAYKDEGALGRFLGVLGDVPLTDVSPFGIEKWKAERAKHVERSTVNREMNIIRGCFSRAVEWGRIDKSPCASVKAYKVDDQRVRVFSDEELRRIVQDAEPWVSLVCRVTLECLPRLSEVLGIERHHIGPTWIEMRRKGGRVERVVVSDDLRTKLLEQPGDPVFGKISEQAASVRIVRELRRLKIENASHHTARHTGVTLMLERGENPRAIQRLAGWSSMRMLERYGHARDAAIRSAVAGNADYLANLPSKAGGEKKEQAV